MRHELARPLVRSAGLHRRGGPRPARAAAPPHGPRRRGGPGEGRLGPPRGGARRRGPGAHPRPPVRRGLRRLRGGDGIGVPGHHPRLGRAAVPGGDRPARAARRAGADRRRRRRHGQLVPRLPGARGAQRRPGRSRARQPAARAGTLRRPRRGGDLDAYAAVLVAVPLRRTPHVLEEVAERAPKGLVVEIASIKDPLSASSRGPASRGRGRSPCTRCSGPASRSTSR